MMKLKLFPVAVLALVVGLFFSHSFAYNSGINSVTVAVQADALDTVATATESTKVINTKDSDRYAALNKSGKILQEKYDKLLEKSREKVKPGDDETFAVCTYDADTMQLLIDSASGGGSSGSTASIGSGSNGAILLTDSAENWHPPGADRANHQKRQAVLQKPMLAPEPNRSYT